MKLSLSSSSMLLSLTASVLARSRSARSHGLQRPHWAPVLEDGAGVEAGSNVTYNAHWAGAVKNATDVEEVTATLVVPQISLPPGAQKYEEYGLSWWVGVDGVDCRALLQVGFDAVQAKGFDPSYSPWVEWYPLNTQYFESLKLSAGDSVRMTVHVTGPSSGNATFENLSTGQSASATFTKTNSQKKLCRRTAEWIVEDFSTGGAFIPIIDFSNSTFTNSSFVAGGKRSGVQGSDVWDIRPKQGNVTVACNLNGESEVFCKHT